MEWFYALNGQRQGPVTQEQFDQLVQSGAIKADTLVWRAGMTYWTSWGQLSAPAQPLTPESTLPPGEETAICAVSSRVYPKRDMLEYQGQWVSAEHKDVFFQRIREGIPQAGEMHYMGFWIRFLASFIDGICLWVLMVIPLIVFMLITASVTGGMGRNPTPGNIGIYVLVQFLQFVIQIFIALGYEIFFVRKYDATPGKMAIGAKLVRSNGDKLSVGRIIGRYFAKIPSGVILCIGYMMAGWDDQKRALHDHMCDTRVVRK